MAELKTKPSNKSVKAFVDALPDERKRRDARAVMKLMKNATGKQPKLWGTNMVGYGLYRYEYASGHAGEWFVTGFAPRKQNLTIYIMSGFSKFKPLMKKLGKYKTGKSCLYLNKLDDVDKDVLQELITKSVELMAKQYETR